MNVYRTPPAVLPSLRPLGDLSAFLDLAGALLALVDDRSAAAETRRERDARTRAAAAPCPRPSPPAPLWPFADDPTWKGPLS